MKDDTISRAAALDALGERPTVWSDNDDYTLGERNQYDMDRLAIETVPSAQLAQDLPKGCTDTISRAAVVDTIEGVDWYHQNKNGEMVHGANSAEDQPWYKAEDIYKAIEGVPPAQRWIPCKTALPKENGQYIITVKYEHVDGYEDIYSEHGEWVDGHWDAGFGYYHCGRVEKVLAWMPLPKPWEGEK